MRVNKVFFSFVLCLNAFSQDLIGNFDLISSKIARANPLFMNNDIEAYNLSQSILNNLNLQTTTQYLPSTGGETYATTNYNVSNFVDPLLYNNPVPTTTQYLPSTGGETYATTNYFAGYNGTYPTSVVNPVQITQQFLTTSNTDPSVYNPTYYTSNVEMTPGQVYTTNGELYTMTNYNVNYSGYFNSSNQNLENGFGEEFSSYSNALFPMINFSNNPSYYMDPCFNIFSFDIDRSNSITAGDVMFLDVDRNGPTATDISVTVTPEMLQPGFDFNTLPWFQNLTNEEKQTTIDAIRSGQ